METLKFTPSLVYRDSCFVIKSDGRFMQYDLLGMDAPIIYRRNHSGAWAPYSALDYELAMSFSQGEIQMLFDTLISMIFEKEVL